MYAIILYNGQVAVKNPEFSVKTQYYNFPKNDQILLS